MMQWILIAARNVWRNRRRSLFLSGTIATGTIALLLFLAYIGATAQGLRESIIRGGTGNVQIGKLGYFDGYEEKQLQFGMSPEERVAVQRVLARDSRVKRVVPRLGFGGLISNGERSVTFQSTASEPNKESQAFGMFQAVSTGKDLNSDPGNEFTVVLGKEMARLLGVKVGDSVTVMASTVYGGLNAIDLQVVGLASYGNESADEFNLRMPLFAAQELLRTKKISKLVVLLHDVKDTEAVQAALMTELAGKVDVKNWHELVPIFDQVIGLYRTQFIVFGLIIGIVILLSISTMTLTNIFERSKEIGTMRAIGIAALRIRSMFTWEGFMQGAIGAATGCLLAALISYGVNTIGFRLPPPPGRNEGVLLTLLLRPEYVAAVFTVMIMTTMVGAFWVSRRISSLPIVQALKESH